jgi:hypothetical protein
LDPLPCRAGKRWLVMSAALEQKPNSVLAHSVIDEVERRLLATEHVIVRGYGQEHPSFPTFHHFTPGLYCRELHMPAGSLVTSYIHRFEHPYIVSKGDCYVFSDACEWVRVTSPHFGITKAGTRRMLVMVADTIWTTFHTTDLRDIEEIERHVFICPNEELLADRVNQ